MTARIAGRVVDVREGRAAIRDETGWLWVRATPLPTLGSWVEAEGTWDGTEMDGALRTLSESRVPFPAPAGEWRAFRDDGRLQRLRARASMLAAVRDFFRQHDFLEVETPTMVPSPGLDLHLDAYGIEEEERWLITSPEYQMKRVLAGGAERIYQTARCFRRGEVGPRHEPEFTMIEWYRAFAGADEVMRDTESLVAHVTEATTGATLLPRSGIDVAPPWGRLTVHEAFRVHAGVEVDAILPDEERFFRVLIDEVEPKLGDAPLFLTEWPASMASLARLSPDDPKVCERFEAYVGGLEICNGFGELIDPVEQRARLERDRRTRATEGKTVYPIDERFLAALEEGLPPAGGNALGFDRLVMLVLGADRIQDVVALPSERL